MFFIMKGFITAVLFVLQLCALFQLGCPFSVGGVSFTEHKLSSIHINSPPSVAGKKGDPLLARVAVAGEEGGPLLARVEDRDVGNQANSNYRKQKGYSGSLGSNSRIDYGQEIEPSINGAGPPRLSVPRNHLGGSSGWRDDRGGLSVPRDHLGGSSGWRDHRGGLSVPRDHLGELSRSLFVDPRKADLPCPVAAAIAPCVCSFDADYNIDLDCTLVESEEQLANVFQQEFPVKELRGFNMTENSVIRVLDKILNGVTFRSLDFSPGPFVLETISDYFILSLKETLGFLKIFSSQVSSSQFPFAVFGEMTELWNLHVQSSQMTWIPKILLPSGTELCFRSAFTDSIELGTFPISAHSYILGIENNVIESIVPGSFYFVDGNSTASNERVLIDVSRNRLHTLQAGTVPLRNGDMFFRLHDNQITSISPGAFVMPGTTDHLVIRLELYRNLLTTIDEAVFGELMPYVTGFYIYGNPLTCGCDMAWLVTNPDYMAKVDPDATCADGTILHNLDPEVYLALC